MIFSEASKWHPENPHQATHNLGENWSRLIHLTNTNVQEAAVVNYINMLAALRDDNAQLLGLGGTFLGFRRAPAATKNHHAYEGGLVVHLLEMWDTWLWVRGMLNHPLIHDSRVWRTILHHDLHKAYGTYKLISTDPWKTEYANDRSSMLTGPDNVKSLWILNQHGIVLDMEMTNVLMWSEGGWSRTQPKWTSVLAKLAYLLDEFSGNVRARLDTGDLEVAAGVRERTRR